MASWNKLFPRLNWVSLIVFFFFSVAANGNEEYEFRETIFDIHLNGQLVAANVLVLDHQDGHFSVPMAKVLEWRLVPPPGAVFLFFDEEFIPLSVFPGLTHRVDPATLVLRIEAPGNLFNLTDMRHRIPKQAAPQDGIGAYLNYNLQLTDGQNQEMAFSSLFEAVIFAGKDYGTLVNNFIFRAGPGETGLIRLTNTWTKDLVGRKQSIRIGDSITRPSLLSPGFNFGGIQWSTNFSLDPTFITAPLNTITGLTNQPSVVEVFVNNVLRSADEVPAGPFLFNIPGYGTGETDLRVVVTDVLGRQQVIHQSLYVNPNLLAKGLSDFSVQTGLKRENLALKSFDYGTAFFSGTYRYGLTDRLTGEAYLGVEKDLQVVGLLADMVVLGLGRVSASFLGSRGKGASGFQTGIAYEQVNSRFNFGLRSTYTSPDFRQIGSNFTFLPPKWISNARVGMRLGNFGGISLAVIHQINRSTDDVTLLIATQSINLKFATLAIDASVSFEGKREFATAIRLIVPLGRRNTASSSLSKSSGEIGGTAEFRRSLGASDVGVAYRVKAEKSTNDQAFDGSLLWQNQFSSITLDASHFNGNATGRLGVSGAIGTLGGKVFTSRRINNEFAVVSAGGIPGITVYLENRNVGKTDNNGLVHVPGLGAYRENQIRLEISEIPFEAEVGTDELSVVPYFRSGIFVKFPVELTRSATMIIKDADGHPLPAGSPVRGEDGMKKGDIGFGGYTYLTGLGVGEDRFKVQIEGQECTFALDVPEILEAVPDLGEVECR